MTALLDSLATLATTALASLAAAAGAAIGKTITNITARLLARRHTK